MGVITFDDRANLTYDLSAFTPSFQAQLTTYIDTEYLTRGPFTNWADALNLASRNWGVPIDIFVFFTDGQPEVSTGPGKRFSVHSLVCAKNFFFSLSFFFLI